MPKRAVTPPPADDEPKYLTVVHPYPLHAHMELPKDREDFGRWVACCIGSADPFYAFFHKPSAPNMVIVEVKRDYPDFDRLLGEHKWKEFLRNPSKEEETKISQVFYCVYNSGRMVQKNGWKRIDAQESWFKNFSPKNELITYPYPETSHCDLPAEDRTNHPLCRPLPRASFNIPPVVVQTAVRAPPPGSAGWVSQKTNHMAPTRGAWGRGTPTSLHIPASSRTGKPPLTVKSASAATSGASSPWNQGGPVSALPSTTHSTTTKNPWNRAPSSSVSSIASSSSVTSPISGRDSSSDASESSAFSIPLPVFDLPAPPGLNLPAISWADDIPAGLFPDIIVNNAQSTLPPLAHGAALPILTQYPDVPDHLEDAFAQLGVADPMEGYASMWEYDVAQKKSSPEISTAVSGSLWDDYVEPKPVVQELLCADHGRICKKGICKTYAKQLKEQERAKKMAESPGGERGKGRGKGRGGRGSNNRRDDQQNWRANNNSSNSNRNSNNNNRSISSGSGTDTPLDGASSQDGGDKDDGFSVIASSKGTKRGRDRAGSIESTAPSEAASGWGTFSNGPWS